MTAIKSTPLFTFPKDKPVELTALVRGSDGAPYVLDNASKTVFRIDLAKKTATAVLKSGQRTASGRVANPKFLTVGGPDVLVLDDKNQLWRWRPANNSGRGTLVRIPVKNSASWGSDVKDLSTFVANFDAAFYKLYVVDPSEQNIMVLDPANDGSGYPSKPTRRLPTDRPVDGITDLMIDGDIFVAENGQVARVIPASGWSPQLPADTELRPNSDVHDALVADPRQRQPQPARRRPVRLRRRQPPDRRVQQVGREVPRPVPAPGRRRRRGPTSRAWTSCRPPRPTRRRPCGGSRTRA